MFNSIALDSTKVFQYLAVNFGSQSENSLFGTVNFANKNVSKSWASYLASIVFVMTNRTFSDNLSIITRTESFPIVLSDSSVIKFVVTSTHHVLDTSCNGKFLLLSGAPPYLQGIFRTPPSICVFFRAIISRTHIGRRIYTLSTHLSVPRLELLHNLLPKLLGVYNVHFVDSREYSSQ